NVIFPLISESLNSEICSSRSSCSQILEKCSHCMAGKQTRVSFKKHPPSRESEMLEFMHFDVCGPLKVYTLKSKDQQGIRPEKTPPKTSQLNGITERMNRTLIERVRCMFSKAKLPKNFWGEALYIAVHVINLSPTVALNTKVPNKIWFGKDIKYDHLRVFGCKAFVHVLKDKRSKLDMKTRQCIFIWYGHDEYGYWLYELVEKKLVKSHNVQFMEDQTIEDIDKVKKTTHEKDNSLSKIDQVQILVNDLDTTNNNVQNSEQHNYVVDQHPGDGFDIPFNDDVEEE
ncbi:hypothetical protein CR513_33552, partial [Mucuna pruriens]